MASPESSLVLFEMFEAHARAAPQRTLVRAQGAGLTMNAAALLERARDTAAELKREGVAEGDVVMLAGLSGCQLTVAQLAVWARGASLIAAEAQLSGPEVLDLRRAFSPRAVLGPGQGIAPRIVSDAGPTAGGAITADGVAVIKLTSGSTGRPRGIATTAAQLLADARHIAEGMGITRDDVCIAAIPLSHSYGMANILMQLVSQGSPILFVPSPLPDLLAEALSIEEPAVFAGVPYMFEMMGREGSPTIRRRGLRTCLSAAAPLRPATAAAFRERVGLPIRSFYGTSETGGITYDSSPDGEMSIASDGCVGTPLPGVRVTLEGDEGRVVVSSSAVSSGYVGAPAEADGAPREGGEFTGTAFRTGDTGRFDEHGRLQLTGRISALVNVSGRKVNPREVERSLASLPGICDAAVLGVSDGVRGESLVAFVSAGPGLTRERIIGHLRDGLAPYKIPRRVVFLSEFPRGPRGKLDHETLRRLASEFGAREKPEETDDAQ